MTSPTELIKDQFHGIWPGYGMLWRMINSAIKMRFSAVSSSSSSSNLDKVINADEVAVLVVAELPWVSMCYEPVWNRQSLGKVDHPCTDVDVVTDDQQRTANDLHSQQQDSIQSQQPSYKHRFNDLFHLIFFIFCSVFVSQLSWSWMAFRMSLSKHLEIL